MHSSEGSPNAFAGLFQDSLQGIFHGLYGSVVQGSMQLIVVTVYNHAAIYSPGPDDSQLLLGLDLLVLNHDSIVGSDSGQGNG